MTKFKNSFLFSIFIFLFIAFIDAGSSESIVIEDKNNIIDKIDGVSYNAIDLDLDSFELNILFNAEENVFSSSNLIIKNHANISLFYEDNEFPSFNNLSNKIDFDALAVLNHFVVWSAGKQINYCIGVLFLITCCFGYKYDNGSQAPPLVTKCNYLLSYAISLQHIFQIIQTQNKEYNNKYINQIYVIKSPYVFIFPLQLNYHINQIIYLYSKLYKWCNSHIVFIRYLVMHFVNLRLLNVLII